MTKGVEMKIDVYTTFDQHKRSKWYYSIGYGSLIVFNIIPNIIFTMFTYIFLKVILTMFTISWSQLQNQLAKPQTVEASSANLQQNQQQRQRDYIPIASIDPAVTQYTVARNTPSQNG